MLLTLSPLDARGHPVRLACLIHAASVHSEPGSNSPLQKKFDTPGRLTGRFQFLGGNLRPSSRPAQVRALRSKELNCLSIASYCAALLPRSPSPFRATSLLYHRFWLLQVAAAIFRELFFVHPEGTLTFPRATSLSYHGFPSLQADPAIFFAARPAGRPGCLRFRHVRPLPFPALADNEPAVTSLRKRSVRPTRRGSEKKPPERRAGLDPSASGAGRLARRPK